MDRNRFVALELTWSATLLKPLGSLAAGARMRMHFALFVTFRGDKIASLRNYDDSNRSDRPGFAA